jgi:hypothetical protein
MGIERKRPSASFKARAALVAAKQTKTNAEPAKSFRVHPVQTNRWKKQVLDDVESLSRDGRRRERGAGRAEPGC